MNSRAKIGTLAKTDPALLVPYGGEQRAIGELQALGVTLTPEDYRAIRQSLGGGKKGRARARELVPLACPRCESRLTHFERNGREPYFAATSESSSHGPHCDEIRSDGAGAAASEDVTALSEDDLEFTTEAFLGEPAPREATLHVGEAYVDEAPAETARFEASPPDPCSRAEEPRASTRADENESSPAASSEEPTHYYIAGAAQPSVAAQWRSLALGSTTRRETSEPAEPHGIQLAGARELLIQGLHRALPTLSTVSYRGQDYAVVAAADLHEHKNGDLVAVYGRFIEAEYNAAAGRLTLKATPRSVQVWATAAVPRQLLQVEPTDSLVAPVLSKPVPFLVFGTLYRLGPTCGIPVIRGDSLVLLQPLTAVSREPSAEQVAAKDGLTLLPTVGELRGSVPGQPRDSELSEARDSELSEARDSELSEPRDSELSEPRDSELGEPRDSELYVLEEQVPRASTDLPTNAADAARADGLALLPDAQDLAASGLPAPNATHPPTRGAFSSLRSFASSLRRSKTRGGP